MIPRELDMLFKLDAEVVEDLALAEEAGLLLAELGFAVEPWEALELARSERTFLLQEVERLRRVRRQGPVAFVGGILVDAVHRGRRRHAARARALRADLVRRDPPLDPARREIVIALWIRGGEARMPFSAEIDLLAARAHEARKIMVDRRMRTQRAPAGGVPPDVHPELLEDLREAVRLRQASDSGWAGIELWVALSLAVEERSAVAFAARGLLQPRRDPQTDARLTRFFERALDLRARLATLESRLRRYAQELPIGRYGADTLDLALAFMLASDEGRGRARQWLQNPARFRREAAIRLEGVIGKAQKYQHALRAA